MKTAGIIAEFNPFHKGHELLIKRAKENGADRIVVVMSGNFVQRADAAIMPHKYRTCAALSCGADLVLLLPVAYATANAQTFATAGVDILDSLGCVDELVFGSECGDIEAITKTAELLSCEKMNSLLTSELEKGLSFATARENALRSLDPACAEVIKSPNNILAVEYVSALKRLNSGMRPVTFAREGAGHDEPTVEGDIASASAIRKLMLRGKTVSGFMPEACAEIFKDATENGDSPADMGKLESAILYKMRTMIAEDIALAPDISEGIENRIFAAAKAAVSLDELFSLAKTKRYSHARIRRIVLSCFLGITAKDAATAPPFIRVLGFNEKGAAILKSIKSTARKPVVTKAKDISTLGNEARRCFELEARATDVYSLALPVAKKCSAEIEQRVTLL